MNNIICFVTSRTSKRTACGLDVDGEPLPHATTAEIYRDDLQTNCLMCLKSDVYRTLRHGVPLLRRYVRAR